MSNIPGDILAQASAAVDGGAPQERTAQGEGMQDGKACVAEKCGGHDDARVLAAVAQIVNNGREAAITQSRGFGR